MDISEFLEQLKGAGIELPPDGLSDDAKKLITGALDKSSLEQEIEKARQEKERADAGFRGITADNSKKDLRIKELEKQVAEQTTVNVPGLDKVQSDFTNKVQQLMDKLDSQEKRNQELAAVVARNELVGRLSKELPILADPEFKDMIPITSDETILRERAELLTRFKQKTEEDVIERVRGGYIPSTSPPRVIPGKPETFEREAGRIEAERKAGKITAFEANNQLDRLMQEFNRS